jgi:hypothetical protein
MPQPLFPQEKTLWYPLDRRLGGPKSWSAHDSEEKKSQTLLGTEPLIIKPIAQHYTTELSWPIMVNVRSMETEKVLNRCSKGPMSHVWGFG